MKKLLIAALISVLPGFALAAGGAVAFDKAPVDINDRASLQNGAKLFVNYCLSCHSASYARYNRMGRDLGLTDEQVKENFLFAGQKIGDTMTVAMPAADAKRWFGVQPPDLSVIARARGADYLYTYLRAFYVDEARPFGVNNTVFPDVGMPHVLSDLEGLKKPVYHVTTGEDGQEHKTISGYELVTPGSMKPAEYDKAVGDLVNFLVYLSEPAQLERQRLGWWVMGFLAIFFVVAYLLKKEYWKDVH